MAAIQRGNAAAGESIGRKSLQKGGSGKTVYVWGRTPIEERARYSHDPAEELMPAAKFLGHEVDTARIIEQFVDSPFDPSRRKVLGKLMGMFAVDYQGARKEERIFLKRLLDAANAREAYATNRALHLCGTPHALRRTLALAVAEPAWGKALPQGFLNSMQARTAAVTFSLLGPRTREQVWNLLLQAGKGTNNDPDPLVERALILKAMAARRRWLAPWSTQGTRAVRSLSRFAEQIRGRPRRLLCRCVPPTSVRVKSTTREHGAVLGRVLARFDPVHAWDRPGKALEGTQTKIVYRDAWPELDRSPLLQRPRLHQALAEGRHRPDVAIDSDDTRAFSAFLSGRPLTARQQKRVDRVKRAFKEQGFDVVTDDVLEAIREDATGTQKFSAEQAMGQLLSRYTGATYVRKVFHDQRSGAIDPAQQIHQALHAGFDVPVSADEGRQSASRVLVARHGADPEHLMLVDPISLVREELTSDLLNKQQLPETFGTSVRARSYFAPIALDLFVPPFGLSFPELGVVDRL